MALTALARINAVRLAAITGVFAFTGMMAMTPVAVAQEQSTIDCAEQGFIGRFFTGKYITEAQACEIVSERDLLAAQAEKHADENVLLRNELTALQQQLDQVSADLASSQSTASEMGAQASDYSVEFQACHEQREVLLTENDQLIADRDGLISRANSLTALETEAQAQIQSLKAEIDGLKSAANDNGMALSTEIDSLRRQLETCQTEKASLVAEAEGLAATIRGMDTQLNTLQEAAEGSGALSLENTALRTELENVQAELEGAQALAQMSDDASTTLEADLTAANEQVSALNAQLDAQATELASMNDINANLTAQVAELSDAEGALAARIEEVEALSTRNAALTAQIEAIEVQLQQAQSESAEVSMQVADSQQSASMQLEALNLELGQRDQAIAEQAAQLDIANDARARVEMQLAAAREVLSGSTAKSQAMADELSGSEQQLADAQARLAAMEEQLAAANAELAAAVEANARTNEGALTSQLVAKDVEIERLQASLAAAQAQGNSANVQRTGDAMRQVVIRLNQSGSVDGAAMRENRLVLPNTSLFGAGSATLGSGAADALDPLADQISELLADDADGNLRLLIIGHADKNPISSSRFPSNWELSAHRAAAVVRGLVDRGVDPTRLLAAGQAEFDPLDDGDSQEALATNRRVEVFAY